MKYQFTMFSEKFKPVACIVEAESRVEFTKPHSETLKKAIQKILAKRGWTMADLKKYGYTTWKARKAEKEELEEVGA